ncbi:dihydrodipicolinate reductase [Mycobacteroides immunogenum]|uniref:Dihydrodipicolinate reductase n=1 Tax=Mycobacteroides immunogenum TaxID=83262 RepID=A0A179V5H5_9MYCO|nr:dihydrodipicolinate reductase [Mycobacteroides immunogenum]OAT66964.1 dihydrodipicolinate reductase [Mycobacteroides immunogenum]
MVYRVAQWATGEVGKAAIKAVLAHPELELVGCWVHSPEKTGVDVGELIGQAPIGVTTTNSLDDIVSLQADCVIYSPLLPNPSEVAALLASQKNVVTPVGWFYPDSSGRDLDTTAREAGVTLHGTGIDPGGITDLYPLIFSSMTSAVTYVRAEEYSDIRTYGAPDVIRHIMKFGGTPEEAVSGPMPKLLGGGFKQSLRMILDGMGFADVTIRPDLKVAVATADIDSPIGTIRPGSVAGQQFSWEAFVGDEAVARIAVNWLMGEEHLDPGWSFGPSGPRYEVEVRGTPSSSCTITGFHPHSVQAGLIANEGVVATAAHCVNSVPYVCEAAPGLKSYLDLPLIAGRAHPRLQR